MTQIVVLQSLGLPSGENGRGRSTLKALLRVEKKVYPRENWHLISGYGLEI